MLIVILSIVGLLSIIAGVCFTKQINDKTVLSILIFYLPVLLFFAITVMQITSLI